MLMGEGKYLDGGTILSVSFPTSIAGKIMSKDKMLVCRIRTDQFRKLEKTARKNKVSVAEIIRRLIDTYE